MAMTEKQIQLVVAAKNGDVKSFEELYSLFYDKVYGFIRMIVKNENDAEDILQETFITAWKKLSTLEVPATFSVWIQVVAKNLCAMQLRRKNIAILLDAEQDMENFDTEESEEMLPSVYAEQDNLKERFSKIIDSLSDVQRQTVTLYYFNELSVDEIAEIMECSPGTVKSRLFLARNAIRTEIEEEERKSGQKFYGLLGIPMISLGKVFKVHMESISIGQEAVNASLNRIVSSISGFNVVTVGGVTNEGVKGKNTLSGTAKVLLGLAGVAVVGGAVALMIIFMGTGKDKNGLPIIEDPSSNVSVITSGDTPISNEKMEEDDPKSSVEATDPNDSTGSSSNTFTSDTPVKPQDASGGRMDEFDIANGYWYSSIYPSPEDNAVASDDKFVGFFRENDSFRIEYGLFRSSYWIGGEITSIVEEENYRFEITIFIPAVAAIGMDEARPERTEIIYVHTVDHRTNIRIESLPTGEWYSYEWGGFTLEEAFNNSYLNQ